MKQFSTLIFLLCFSNSFGQFAVVNDKDGFLNVRTYGLKNSKIVDKLRNGDFIYCFEDEGNWTNIDYLKNGEQLNGYVYKDRYKLISTYPSFSIFKKTEAFIILKKDSIAVTITQSKFNKEKRKFKYDKHDRTQIELIDNDSYWGTDGGKPKTQFEKITLRIGEKSITLPQKALNGLYEPNIYNAAVNYDNINDTIYIQMMNSDGAGGYLVIWKIEKGVYKDRLVTHGF